MPRPPDASAGESRLFVLTVPGLQSMAADELAALPGVRITGRGSDGRADVVLLTATEAGVHAVRASRTAEDVFLEVGRTLRSEGDRPHWIAGRLWRQNRVRRSSATWTALTGRSSTRTSYRVIVRVLQEQSFGRTELRRALDKTVRTTAPAWTSADPAKLEIWALEYVRGRFVAGLRISDARMRQHGGRDTERTGALRPAVAAAMIAAAGPAAGVLLDPCCGSGTILSEAAAAGWAARGIDIDSDAVTAARRNAKRAEIEQGDARRTGLDDASVAAVVSNLPFGKQYGFRGDPAEWTGELLVELARVTADGAPVVLLAPSLPKERLPKALGLADRQQLRLLGTPTAIWTLRRRSH